MEREWLLQLLEIAQVEAGRALARGDEPYGAVIAAADGRVIAADGNRENSAGDPTRHAEINAIARACRALGRKSLRDCVLVGNYRPCPMCAAAILMTGIGRVYTGSPFAGFADLFESAAAQVRKHDAACAQPGLDPERCAAQVRAGRARLKMENSDYRSGHKGGIL